MGAVGYSLLCAALLIIATERVEATYELWVRVVSWSGTGYKSNGACCDGIICNRDCDNKFRFCMRPYGYSASSDDDCPLGSYSTSTLGSNSITFSSPIQSGVPNPMVFTGGTWTGSFQLYVKVIDNDVWPNADDLVDEVYVSMVGLAVSNTFTTATAYNGLHEQGSITLQFQVVCNANYYGSNCTTFCVATDNTMGHYTCASDGSKQCLSGWSNSAGNCLTPVCSAGCSPVGGYCTQPNQCLCNSGWTGSNCSQCITSSGCVHGTCTLPNQCNCNTNWGGANCDIDLIPCQTQSPCQHGASCTNNGAGGYQCSCAPGYYGTNCENEMNECLPNPCHSGSTCVDMVNGYLCQCAPGWTGVDCAINIDDCSPNPCTHGTCNDQVNGFSCSCVAGYYGTLCETDVDECASNPCTNGATCTDTINNYTCSCVEGYTGKNCDINIDDCNPTTCVNGTCSGRNCEYFVNSCSSSPCQNGGTCTNTRNGFNCTCVAQFIGSSCQLAAQTGQTYFVAAVVGSSVGIVVAISVGVIMVVMVVVIVMARRKRRQKQFTPTAINVVTVGDNPLYLSQGCTVDDDSCYDTVRVVRRGSDFHNPLYDLTKDEDKVAADDYCEVKDTGKEIMGESHYDYCSH